MSLEKDRLSILIAARGLIANGWIQGRYFNTGKTTAYCAVGAIDSVPLPGSGMAKKLLISKIKGNSIVAWNDEPGRTLAEVLAVFDAAIQDALVSLPGYGTAYAILNK